MGVIDGIGYAREDFPTQGNLLNRRVLVAFRYDLEHLLDGTVVRDAVEAPFQTIIRLEDGRHVLATECQFTEA